MTKLELIDSLISINAICVHEQDKLDKEYFGPIITKCPKVGSECLKIWTSRYFVSFNSKLLIERFEVSPTWDNFHIASYFLMIDRIIAAIAMDGNIDSKFEECIDLTLRCGNISEEILTWVEFYTGIATQTQLVA